MTGFQTFLVGCLIVVIIGGAFGLVITVAYCHTVDYSQAMFEPGDIVWLKVGGYGQVIKRSGHNEGMIWDLNPVYEYEVRHEVSCGTRKQIFQEWELRGDPC